MTTLMQDESEFHCRVLYNVLPQVPQGYFTYSTLVAFPHVPLPHGLTYD
jgi:hypothetical protein